jgi:hypothetical protein
MLGPGERMMRALKRREEMGKDWDWNVVVLEGSRDVMLRKSSSEWEEMHWPVMRTQR